MIPAPYLRSGFCFFTFAAAQSENRMSKPLKTFICYAHEDHEVVDGLKKQLAIFEKKGLLQIWSDGKILAGEHWDKSIKTQLEHAEIILLFISVDFINSDYIEKNELQAALQRHRDGHATLIPIIVRPCHWAEYFDIGQFQALPSKARPILSSHFPHLEEAFFEIASGVKKTAEDLRDKKIADAIRAEEETSAQKKVEAKASRLAKKNETQRIKDGVAWRTAKKLDSIEAYEIYLAHNHTLYSGKAHKQISELKFRQDADLMVREKANKFSIGLYTFDYKNLTLSTEGYSETLTPMEADLLKLLNNHRNQVLKRSEILVPIWGEDDYKSGRSLDVFITRLRKYLSLDKRIEIENIHGVGFNFRVKD